MSGHIRPKKRSPAAGATTSSNHQEVEETRQRLERWTGLQNQQQQPEQPRSPPTSAEAGEFTAAENELPVVPKSTTTPSSKPDPPSTPNSILKSKPKYSGANVRATESAQNTVAAANQVLLQGTVQERPRRRRKNRKHNSNNPVTSNDSTRNEEQSPEPDPSSRVSFSSHSVPTKTTTAEPSDQTNKDDILSFNSIADLMEAAGEVLPSSDETPQVIEAGLEFSCFTPQEFTELQQEERQVQYDVFMGRHRQTVQSRVLGDNENTTDDMVKEPVEDANEDDGETATDKDDDDDLYNLFDPDPADDYYSEEEEQDASSFAPRAFLLLHNALSQWITPQAVAYVRRLQETNYQETLSLSSISIAANDDVAASRCAGLLALFQMHTAHCLEALQQHQQQQQNDPSFAQENWQIRTADQRLMEWVRTCNFAWPAPKLDSKLARALVCVLLDTLLGVSACITTSSLANDKELVVPEPCRAVGMTAEEYRYLAQSAVVRFSAPSDEALA